MDESERLDWIEDAARWLMSLIDSRSFRDEGFMPGTITDTLRRSGEASGLRDALKVTPQSNVIPQRRGSATCYDDSGDDEMHDGGIGIPGYGFAREHEELP